MYPWEEERRRGNPEYFEEVNVQYKKVYDPPARQGDCPTDCGTRTVEMTATGTLEGIQLLREMVDTAVAGRISLAEFRLALRLIESKEGLLPEQRITPELLKDFQTQVKNARVELSTLQTDIRKYGDRLEEIKTVLSPLKPIRKKGKSSKK